MLEEKREPSSDSLLAANIPKAPSGSGSAPAQLHFLILAAQGRDGRADIRLWVADPQTRSGEGGRVPGATPLENGVRGWRHFIMGSAASLPTRGMQGAENKSIYAGWSQGLPSDWEWSSRRKTLTQWGRKFPAILGKPESGLPPALGKATGRRV